MSPLIDIVLAVAAEAHWLLRFASLPVCSACLPVSLLVAVGVSIVRVTSEPIVPEAAALIVCSAIGRLGGWKSIVLVYKDGCFSAGSPLSSATVELSNESSIVPVGDDDDEAGEAI